MVLWMDRDTQTFTPMGGEGANWLGVAPFTETSHVFVNLGDGTYAHSGLLAIRAAVAAGVNITYKLLYNDAVAMTGGQPAEGAFSVPQIVRQLAAEGVAKVVVVSDEPEKYPAAAFASGVTVHHRRELDRVQRELRDRTGVSVLVYDQTCAAEKRRRRKRGTFPDPAKRVVINEAVCEGCGDCSTASNCLSVEPLETEFGRKRTINQSSCNKDYSCAEGFCPSFVTVHGGRLRKPSVAAAAADPAAGLPAPATPALEGAYDVLIAGIGGTGVVTLGQLLGMAAHLEGRAASVLDFHRAGAEGRRGPLPRSRRRRGGRDPRQRHRRRRPAPAAGLRHRRRGQLRGPGQAPPRAKQRGRQRPPRADRRLHPRSGRPLRCRRAQRRDLRGDRRRGRRVRRCHAPRHGADRRCHRRQHVRPRLRGAARAGAGGPGGA